MQSFEQFLGAGDAGQYSYQQPVHVQLSQPLHPGGHYGVLRGLGVKLKTERGNRVFPVSDKAEDVVNALRRFIKDRGVEVRYETVKEIKTEDGRVASVVTGAGETPAAPFSSARAVVPIR
jgi:glycine/D-amino acid oxidase-like deaminating enzyme